MRLARAAVMPYCLPLRAPLRGMTERRGFILRLQGDDETVGYGEAAPVWWDGEESLEETRRGLEVFVSGVNGGSMAARRLCGRMLTAAGGHPLCERALAEQIYRWSPAALCAVDTALLDLEAKLCGLSVAELLGAASLGEVGCNALIVAPGAAEVRTQARALARRGFGTIKIKVGGQAVEADVARVAAVRAAAGRKARIRVDANRSWDFPAALEALQGLRAQAVDYVEEPLRSSDPGSLAKLRQESGVPIAVDESLRDIRDLARFAAARACDVVVLKLARLGGPNRALELARHAEVAHMRVVFTDSIETAVGRAAVLHAALAAPGERTAVGLGGSALLRNDLTGSEPASRPAEKVRGPGLGLPPLEA